MMAVNLWIRPPLTVLETRLILTSLSWSSSELGFILCCAILPSSELQAALTGTLGKFLYTSVIDITGSVEYDVGYALFGCSFGNSLADLLRGFLVAAVSGESGLISGGGYERCTVAVINDLSTDVSQ